MLKRSSQITAALLLVVPPWVAAGPIERDRIVVDIPAENGVVRWNEIGVRLADAAQLDGEVLRDLLPSGRLRLGSTKTRFVFAAVNLSTKGGLTLRVREDDQGASLLRIEVDRTWVRRQRAKLERAVRERRHPEQTSDGCRLELPHEFESRLDQRELVLLTHGYNGTARALQPLRQRLKQTGYVVGVFIYPNDGSPEAAAEGLSRELKQLGKQFPALRVALVTHSMGGLIARRVIEDSTLDPGCVSRLVMIAPPNHGSNLANLPFGLDIWEHLGPASTG